VAAASRPTRVAVIGWGNFFNHIHEQTVRDLAAAGRLHLHTVCVRSADTAREIGERFPPFRHEPDYRAVLADPNIDAVLIGTPHNVQAQIALDALKAGKYVYVEKPMFADEADTGRPTERLYNEFVALGDIARDRLAVGLNKRFAPAYLDIKAIADQHSGLKHIHMSIVDDAWRWGAKYPPGFLLWLDVCHWFDLARWFTGSEVARISCLSPRHEDSLAMLHMRDGAVVTIFLSGNATMDLPKEELFALSGQRVSFRATDYIELEVFGGAQPDRRRYAANLQSGGDLELLRAINDYGLEAFRRIRRVQFELFNKLATAPDAAQEKYLKRNIPNFMRDQGWRGCVTNFINAVAERRAIGAATYHDAYIAYRLLESARKSFSSNGTFVEVPA